MKKIIIFLLIIAGAFGLISFLYIHQQKDNTAVNPYGKKQLNPASVELINNPEYQNIITPDDLKKKLKHDKDVFVYFFSPTCPYCKKATPIVNDVMKHEGITLYKYNLLEFTEGWSDYGIKGTPTLIHYVNGKEVSRVEGLKDKVVYSKWTKWTTKQ